MKLARNAGLQSRAAARASLACQLQASFTVRKSRLGPAERLLALFGAFGFATGNPAAKFTGVSDAFDADLGLLRLRL